MRGWATAASLALLLTASNALAGEAAPVSQEGFRWKPNVAYEKGDHELFMNASLRYRWEYWQARAPQSSNFNGLRGRVGLGYSWKDTVTAFAEAQFTGVMRLSTRSSGAGALYFNNNDTVSGMGDAALRRLFIEGKRDGNYLRLGRQDLKSGTAIAYKAPNWSYLKNKRLGQRLVGGVGWTNGERSYDGGAARWSKNGHAVHAYIAQPTTGVFVIRDSYLPNYGITFGGIEYSVEPKEVLRNTEVSGFFLGYSDDRDPAKVAGLFGNIQVYTVGGSALGVYPLGPGNVDMVLWGAFQTGQYHALTNRGVENLPQMAGAFIVESGYQLPDVWSKPWLRFGINWASGDSDPNDGSRSTFFNLLPTNHLYYGYTDQLAFQNLIDFLIQLKLTPIKKLGVEFAYHRFWLEDKGDLRWAGSGAFSRKNLGYVGSPSNNSTDVGHELDIVLGYTVNEHVSLLGGWAKMWGGKVFAGTPNDGDTDWAFLQIALKY